jgi:hypothetical protein
MVSGIPRYRHRCSWKNGASKADSPLDKLLLQFQPAEPRKRHVEHQRRRRWTCHPTSDDPRFRPLAWWTQSVWPWPMDRCSLFACSPHPQSSGERLEQRIVAERLEQALCGPLRQEARTDSVVTVRGDEYNRNRLPPADQLTPTGSPRVRQRRTRRIQRSDTRGIAVAFCPRTRRHGGRPR